MFWPGLLKTFFFVKSTTDIYRLISNVYKNMRSLLRGILYGESSGLSNYRLYIGLGNISLIRLTFSSPTLYPLHLY